MLTDSRVRSAVLAAVAAAVSSARADSEQATRAVIRGTGNDVEVVYQAPVAPPRLGFVGVPAADPVREALALQASGAGDSSVVALLQRRQADLPAVIDASVVREFRKAGAGDSVVGFLSAHMAVDIGRTAEAVPRASAPAGAEMVYPGGEYADAVGAGYPFYGAGGYGSYGYAGRGGRGGFFNRPIGPPGHRGPMLPSHAFEFFRPSPPRAAHPMMPMRPSAPAPRPRMP
jgi:hypothetical protein